MGPHGFTTNDHQHPTPPPGTLRTARPTASAPHPYPLLTHRARPAPCSFASLKFALRQSALVKFDRRRSWPSKFLPWRSASPYCAADPRPNSPPCGDGVYALWAVGGERGCGGVSGGEGKSGLQMTIRHQGGSKPTQSRVNRPGQDAGQDAHRVGLVLVQVRERRRGRDGDERAREHRQRRALQVLKEIRRLLLGGTSGVRRRGAHHWSGAGAGRGARAAGCGRAGRGGRREHHGCGEGRRYAGIWRRREGLWLSSNTSLGAGWACVCG